MINLTVHGIGEPVRPLDPGEDGTWVSVGQFERVLDACVGRTDVRITFDDGNSSDLVHGLPMLLERGLTAEFFVLAGRLDEDGRVDADGVRALLDAGMGVGSHGWDHVDWRRLDEDGARRELTEAGRVLSEVCGRPVDRVAVPFGSYDRRVLRRLRRAGVRRVYTSDGGPARPDAWLQPRTSLRRELDDAWIDDVLSGRPGPLRRTRRAAARLVKRLR
ncbi:MAG TPA: polysaccharide deacetylase family protein [Pseudonocardiaceae bacterium]